MTKNSTKGFPINRLHYFMLIAIAFLFLYVVMRQNDPIALFYAFNAFLVAEAVISLGRIHDITSNRWGATLKVFIPFLIVFSTSIFLFYTERESVGNASIGISQLLILILFFIPSNLIKRS